MIIFGLSTNELEFKLDFYERVIKRKKFNHYSQLTKPFHILNLIHF